MITIECETGDHVQVDASSLMGANLRGLNLHRALLGGQALHRADLSGTDLRSAWLERTRFDGALLRKARFPAAQASEAIFRGADLSGAFLRSATFDRADFTRATMLGANVGRSTFRGAVLYSTDLRCEDIEEADLTGARADGATRWPEGYVPADHGVLSPSSGGRDLPSLAFPGPIVVSGERRKVLGPRMDVAEVELRVEPAHEFEVVVAVPSAVEGSEPREFLDWAIFGFLDVVLTEGAHPLRDVRVTVSTALFDPIHSNQMAFRHAGRDAGRKLLAVLSAAGAGRP